MEASGYLAVIKVVGVGGGGGNAVNTMIDVGLEGVEFIVVNTDAQALQTTAPTEAPHRRAAHQGPRRRREPEDRPGRGGRVARRIKEALKGADMVFVTAGMGGGTGTGAAPVDRADRREEGALTVGVVTQARSSSRAPSAPRRARRASPPARARRHADHDPEREAHGARRRRRSSLRRRVPQGRRGALPGRQGHQRSHHATASSTSTSPT